MFKKFLGSVREFKTPTILTLTFIVLEAIIEACIPFITAELINYIQSTTEGSLSMMTILSYGGLLILMALASLACGGTAAYTCARLVGLCPQPAPGRVQPHPDLLV